MSQSPLHAAKDIQLLILDVDGVLTGGHIYFGPEQESIKAFHSHDGQGIRLLLDNHIHVAIITGRQSNIVVQRASELGIEHIFQGQKDKSSAYYSIQATLGLTPQQIAYVGDDLPDLPIIRDVALGVAVANAHPFVHENAPFHTEKTGGAGAVREVCDWILTARGLIPDLYQQYLTLPPPP